MFKDVKYIWISFVLTIFCVVGFYVFRPSKNEQNLLVVGMMSGWAPFMTINQSGDFVGFDVDVAQKVADRLGKKLVIKDFGSLSTLLVALQQNKIDFAMSGLDITPKRLQIMDMISYTGADIKSFYLLFWNQIPEGVASVQDLKKFINPIVCSEPGSPQARSLEQFDFIEQKSLSKIEDLVLDVKFGKSLAMIAEPQIAAILIAKNPELKKLEMPLPEDFQTFGMGIALTKNNTLTDRVKHIVEMMRTDGTLPSLEKQWGLAIEGQK